jgi:hypothetical protein
MTADLYRATLREMVDPHHPLVRLTGQIPGAALEAQMALLLELRIPRLLGHGFHGHAATPGQGRRWILHPYDRPLLRSERPRWSDSPSRALAKHLGFMSPDPTKTLLKERI